MQALPRCNNVRLRFFIFTLLVCLCACKRLGPIRLQPTIEEQPTLSNTILMTDPASSGQLLDGFYELEGNSWRWTAPHFSVALAAPPTARTDGAWLVLKFTLPGVSIDTLKNITVSCRLADAQLAPETFRTSGALEYRREVPASAFAQDIVAAEFSVDKFLKPPGDGRELGLVATAIRLAPK